MDALDLLKLQMEWGADEALDDTPVDRLRPAPPPSLPRVPTQLPAASPVARGTPAERALSVAGQADTLDELRAAIAAFDGCVLRETAANLVFAEGDPATGLLLIGDTPGEAEDRTGKPFAGPDGALLERMLASIGLTRRDLVLAPLIPWRPPGGRPPNPAEIAVCLPFLHRLIILAAPNRVLLAGPLAVRALLGPARRRAPLGWMEMAVPGLSTMLPALPLPALATLPRTPVARRDAWAALRLLRRAIDGDVTKM